MSSLQNTLRVCRLLAVAALAAASPVLAQVDPIVQARELRYAGRLDEAERVLNRVLRKDKNDYMAQYNMGLVNEARAAKLGLAAGPPRVALLRTAAAWLEKALATRVRGNIPEYTIYNTLGYVYLLLGDVTNADRVLTQGMPFATRLTSASQAKFNGNLGYLASLKGQSKAASGYFDKAAAAGNIAAQVNQNRLKTTKK